MIGSGEWTTTDICIRVDRRKASSEESDQTDSDDARSFGVEFLGSYA
jgi:hypothetical protein